MEDERQKQMIGVFDYLDLDYVTLPEAINTLQKVKANLEANGVDLDLTRIEIRHYESEITISYKRLESDEEFNRRIAKLDDRDASIRRNELNELARLKAKYE